MGPIGGPSFILQGPLQKCCVIGEEAAENLYLSKTPVEGQCPTPYPHSKPYPVFLKIEQEVKKAGEWFTALVGRNPMPLQEGGEGLRISWGRHIVFAQWDSP